MKSSDNCFSTVSFTGRDEDISDDLRIKQRYTLSGMTHDLKNQLGGQLQPLRDWFPLSSYSFHKRDGYVARADAPGDGRRVTAILTAASLRWW